MPGDFIPAGPYVSAVDAKVADAINDGTTTVAPSQNAVFDALALKANAANPTLTGTVTVPDASFANAKLANMAARTFKGRHTNSTGAPEDVSAANVLADLIAAAGTPTGSKFIRDDGTLASPSAALSITTPNMVSGSMILPGVITLTTRGATRAWSADTLYYMPFLPLQAMTVTGLELEYVSTAGSASSVARIGIYETGATLQPGNLVVDAGNVAIDSLGRRNVTGLSAALTAGQLYLFAFHPSAAVTTYQRTGTLITGPLIAGGGTAGQYYFWLSVSKTQAALATPGTAWNAPSSDNTKQMYYPVGISSWT